MVLEGTLKRTRIKRSADLFSKGIEGEKLGKWKDL